MAAEVDKSEPLVKVSSYSQMEAAAAKGDQPESPEASAAGPGLPTEVERQATRIALLLEARATRAIFPHRIPSKRLPQPLVVAEIPADSVDEESDAEYLLGAG